MQSEQLADKVFSLLKGNGFQIKIFDQGGNETANPSEGRRFFISDPNFMITIDEDNNELEFNKGADTDFDKFQELQDRVRKIANDFLLNFSIKVFGKSIQPRDFSYKAKMHKDRNMNENTSLVQPVNSHLLGQVLNKIKYFGKISAHTLADELAPAQLNDIQRVLNTLVKEGKIVLINNDYNDHLRDPVYSIKMEEVVAEGLSKMTGSSKTSKQTLENVKLIVRHKKPVNEQTRGARSRSISAIFLECNGERFRFPHSNLSGARAMAQHMAHEGTMYDKIGSYIIENTGWLMKLQSFNRYATSNNLINEDSSIIIDTIKENIETIKSELRKFTGNKTYETIKARISTFERSPLQEDDLSNLKELFTIKRFDEKFEEVLPIVKQLVQEKNTYLKRIEESANSIIRIRYESLNDTPILEFSSKNAQIGFKLNELALRMVENTELSEFIAKVGNKLCKEGIVNDFEKAIIKSVFENVNLVKESKKDIVIKESENLSHFFDKYDCKFY